jgi:hypothetical protein
MLRRNVPTMSGKMLAILHVPVVKKLDICIYIIMTGRFGKSYCWNRFVIFWNVRARLQGSVKSTCVDGVSRLSGLAICK